MGVLCSLYVTEHVLGIGALFLAVPVTVFATKAERDMAVGRAAEEERKSLGGARRDWIDWSAALSVVRRRIPFGGNAGGKGKAAGDEEGRKNPEANVVAAEGAGGGRNRDGGD
ncbi:hypothetical protein T484DRAFT_1889459 [Baffinella frigidus]|nr:hypothetical protein T484DRAFT_1889459 [Cryptophyta sp. CCMP2293]